jgi:DNA helicase II / ATP-dependent DNA helicase PcrA
MVTVDIPITEEEIRIAEDIFLPKGASFDDQKREILKSIDTIDIKAVPGSGKTTVLLAKLFILAQRMPSKDKKGVCILTHTNVAINEIRARLGSNTDTLFTYPNFLGTFQSFVDKYLAIPYYALRRNSRSIIIDQKYYEEKINKQLKIGLKGFNSNPEKKQVQKNARYYLNSNVGLLNSIRLGVSNGKNILINGNNGKEINIKRPSRSYKKLGDFTPEEKKNVYNWILKLKLKLLNDGVLCYEDAYYLAEVYINKYGKQLRELFSNRFKYVLVDETQDTNHYQNRILKNLFDDCVMIQKFGDPHQAIFDSGNSNHNTYWNPTNETSLEISQSQRFGKSIAEKLKTINVEEKHEIVGNTLDRSLKPHIILFNHANISGVLEKFVEIIKIHNLHMSENGERVKDFNAVGWRGSETEDISQKLCLSSYFPNYNVSKSNKKSVHFNSLISYIKKRPKNDVDEKGVKVYYDSIINGILRFLYLADIKNDKETLSNRYFSKSSLMFYLKDYYNKEYIQLKEQIGKWIYDIHHGHEQYNFNVYEEIKNYLMYDLKSIWPSISSSKVKDFLEDDPFEIIESNLEISNNYISPFHPEIQVKVDTVHGVKGETHKATLYLETYYKGIHDLRKILPSLKGEYNKKIANQKTGKEALKVAYVGMSRPTHLLCLAMNSEELSPSDIDDLNNNGWEIVYVKEPVTTVF